MRFHIKKGARAICMVLSCLLMSMQSMHVCADEENLQLYAKAAVLMDADSMRVLYGKNQDEKLPMASTTKIMTLLITLEQCDLSEVVTISNYAASMPNVQLNCRSGEQYYLKDLVYSMMLESHNDSAVAIAEHVGGTVQRFAQMMNQRAKEIGCEDTCFVTPNGLDATDENGIPHGTTARDLAVILSYCITRADVKEQFLEITQTPTYSFSDLSGNRVFYCTNHNVLLHMMEGALTGKTGFTGNAGYCYAGAVERDGKKFVVALLACGWPSHKSYKWADMKTLITYGFSQFEEKSLAEVEIPKEYLQPVLVTHTETGTEEGQIEVAEQDVLQEVMLLHKEKPLVVTCERIRQMTAPVQYGEIVGKIRYYSGEECVKELSMVSLQEKKQNSFWKVLQIITEYWRM